MEGAAARGTGRCRVCFACFPAGSDSRWCRRVPRATLVFGLTAPGASRPSVAAAWWQSTATATAFHGAVVPDRA
jgi:hypothetical protein